MEVDLSDPLENIYRFAESYYLRNKGLGSIQSIDIVSNPTLTAAFEMKKSEFKRNNIPHKPIFAFHGTSAAVIDNILKTNFDVNMARRQAHGPGNYFSEYPSTALGYSNDGKHLIFCQILPGRQYKGGGNSWSGFDSKLVSPGANDVSQMVIIQDKNQILPYCVINL